MLFFLGLGNRDANCMSFFHCDPLYSVPRGMDHDVLRDLFPVLEHGPLKHSAGQRLAASRARDGVCDEHFRDPRVGRRAGILADWLHRRSYEHACSGSVCVRNNFLLRPGVAYWCEISSRRHGRHRGRTHEVTPVHAAKSTGSYYAPGFLLLTAFTPTEMG